MADVDDDNIADSHFDWSPWGRDRWQAWGRSAKCRARQIRYCASRWRGVSELESARRAGYLTTTNDEAARQQAFHAENSKGVRALLAMVEELVGKGTGPLSDAEGRLLLTEQARFGDGSVRIAAIKALREMDDRDRSREREERARSADEAFLVAVKSAPVFGVPALAEMYLEKHKSLPFGSPVFRRLAVLIADMHSGTWRAWKLRLPGHEDEMDLLAAAEWPDEAYSGSSNGNGSDVETAQGDDEAVVPPPAPPPDEPLQGGLDA
jgi:hypothetical protein